MNRLFRLLILTLLPFGFTIGVNTVAQASFELSDDEDELIVDPAPRLSDYEEENGKTWFAINKTGVIAYQSHKTVSGWIRSANGDLSDRNFVPFRMYSSEKQDLRIPTLEGLVRVSLEKNDPLRMIFLLGSKTYASASGGTKIPLLEGFVTAEDGEETELTLGVLRKD